MEPEVYSEIKDWRFVGKFRNITSYPESAKILAAFTAEDLRLGTIRTSIFDINGKILRKLNLNFSILKEF
ncbi:hypothetical protein DRO37_04805 [Candidatus Bathyarchaeota archaeon]|nr:MAG: hypothetical protein DRO37_04805 [Candidatus Bathyarchaeota archaeon]